MDLVSADGTGHVTGAQFMVIGQAIFTVHSIALAQDITTEVPMVIMMRFIMALGMGQALYIIVILLP